MFRHPVPAANIPVAPEVQALLDDNQRAVEAYLAGFRFVVLEGESGGGGAATLAHGVDMATSSVLLAQAWCDAGGGNVQEASVDNIDATDVTVTGAPFDAAVRVTLIVGPKRVF